MHSHIFTKSPFDHTPWMCSFYRLKFHYFCTFDVSGGSPSVWRLCRLDEKGSMFSAVVLVLGCLLQVKLVTTEGHRGTNRHVFYAVQMDGGIRAARALAEQHGLEFIQQVGSLEGLYSLRDSRGHSDRATFESRLATAAGLVCLFHPISLCAPTTRLPPSTSCPASPLESTMLSARRAFVARETVTHRDIP